MQAEFFGVKIGCFLSSLAETMWWNNRYNIYLLIFNDLIVLFKTNVRFCNAYLLLQIKILQFVNLAFFVLNWKSSTEKENSGEWAKMKRGNKQMASWIACIVASSQYANIWLGCISFLIFDISKKYSDCQT